MLTVKGNQPRLRRQLAGLPWRQVSPLTAAPRPRHGRREIRTLKVVTVAAGHRVPARRARPSRSPAAPARPARTGRAGKWRTETVYAITDLAPHQARPDELAAWIRGHWQIEVRREVALVE